MNIYVRTMDGTVVRTIDVTGRSPRMATKIVLGLMRNMDLDNYFVDDSEIDQAENEKV